jgi:Lar family restriction alleviation protein
MKYQVDELKPCPFCGGNSYATRTVNGTQMFKVGCAACGIELKAAWYRDEDQPTKDLVGLWNTRAAHL